MKNKRWPRIDASHLTQAGADSLDEDQAWEFIINNFSC